jgi:23S rRNA (guanine2535-N1)-methyltransferase
LAVAMQYLFATERPDYSDLASGRVFYSLPGHPAFPIRLASEILQRCLALRREAGLVSRCSLYDPCCGSGYLAAVLATLHAEDLSAVTASDVDSRAVETARRNLSLLQPEGLARRSAELEELLVRYGKESHRQALVSVQRMRQRAAALPVDSRPVVRAFTINALDGPALVETLGAHPVDVVLTDVPYGQHSQWSGADAVLQPLQALLEALAGVLSPGGLVALVSDKGQKVQRAGWQRCDHFQVGLRRIEILRRAAA